ncbi:hypothetical protein HK100_010437, partial [Physocladia obscura]
MMSISQLSLHLPHGVGLLGLAAGARLPSYIPLSALLSAGVGLAADDGSAPNPLIIQGQS